MIPSVIAHHPRTESPLSSSPYTYSEYQDSPFGVEYDGVVATDEASLRASRCAARTLDKLQYFAPPNNHNGPVEVEEWDRDDLVFGELLGKGAFSSVYQVRTKTLHHNDNSNSNNKEEWFAIKFLHAETMGHDSKFRTGAADLALEGHFLSHLQHDNIISLKAVSSAGVKGFASGVLGGYFLVVNPILECTLNHKIADWRERSVGLQTAIGSKPQVGPFRLSGLVHQEMDLSQERLNVAVQLSSALGYLHSVGLVFRDLKPQNVGFDRHGTVKLFDFGLAKNLDPRRRVVPDDNDTKSKNKDSSNSISNSRGRCLYKMTGSTGSLRYMAPEVSRNEPYNELVDVYSFGILLWEIITLDRAYRQMDKNKHLERVAYGKHRPSLQRWDDQPSESLPSLLDPYMKFLLEYCWDVNLHKRPSMAQVHAVLLDQTDILSITYGTPNTHTKEQQQQESPSQTSSKLSPSRAKAA
eukprot:scaffold171801_cov67-Attheya_sp.AAC.1